MTKKTEVTKKIKATLHYKQAHIQIGEEILQPVASFEWPGEEIVYNGVRLTRANFHPLSFERESSRLDLFIYTCKGLYGYGKIETFYILADENSHLEMAKMEHLQTPPIDYSFHSLILFNSNSQLDVFFGANALSNVTSSYNEFTNSHINGIGYTNRVNVSAVKANNFTFTGGTLRSGFYKNSKFNYVNFVQSAIFEEDLVIGSIVEYVTFKGGSINLKETVLRRCTFSGSKGDVVLEKQSLEDEFFETGEHGVKLLSKFDYTIIDVLSFNKVEVVRINNDDVVIIIPPSREDYIRAMPPGKQIKMSFKNPLTRRSLRAELMTIFFGDVQPSEPEESIIDYLLLTILSRCKIMNLLDSSRRLINNDFLTPISNPKSVTESRPLNQQKKGPVPGLIDTPGAWGPDPLTGSDTENTIYITEDSFNKR